MRETHRNVCDIVYIKSRRRSICTIYQKKKKNTHFCWDEPQHSAHQAMYFCWHFVWITLSGFGRNVERLNVGEFNRANTGVDFTVDFDKTNPVLSFFFMWMGLSFVYVNDTRMQRIWKALENKLNYGIYIWHKEAQTYNSQLRFFIKHFRFNG